MFETPVLWHGVWVFYHDDAPGHDVLVAPEILAETSVTILNHLPYLPDLDQHIFWLFQKLTTTLKGQWLSDVASIKRYAKTMLTIIPEEGFQKCCENAYSLSVLLCEQTALNVTGTTSV